MTDPHAAERARRYRARRDANRDVTRDANRDERDARDVTLVTPDFVTAVTALVTAVTALVTEMRHARERETVTAVTETVTRDAQRDVTRDVTLVTVAPARVEPAALGPLKGPREPLRVERHVTSQDAVTAVTAPTSTQLARITAMLGRAGAPISAASLALELEAPIDKVRGVLLALEGFGKVRRSSNDDGHERWELVEVRIEDAVAEAAITCADYQAHRFEHRRDPASGRFRCYQCDPELAIAANGG